ncbi:MAG: PAS domain S-box protein [Melioribacteraceae bacterium]|nr:PAS domain S-box protein [Melioribacteraceae bacterium]
MATFSEKTQESSKSEISFKEILEYAPIGIMIFQRDWIIKYVNENFFLFPGVLGENPQNVIGQSIYSNRIFNNTDIRPELELLKNGEPFEKEISSIKTLNGNKITLLLKGTPITLSNEQAGGILILEDLKFSSTDSTTDTFQSDESEIILSKISDFYFIINSDGRLYKTNLNDINKYNFLFESDSVKKDVKILNQLIFDEHINDVLTSQKTKTITLPFLIENKETNFSITLIPVDTDEFNKKIFVLFEESNGEFENKFHKDELKELLTYQQIVTSLVGGLIGINKNGRIIFWNETASQIFGLTKSEVYGKPINKIFSQLTDEYVTEIKKRINEHGNWKEVLSIGFDEESSNYFEIEASILNQDENELLFFICENVTEKIKEENKLKDSEEKFRNIVTNSPDYILTTNARGFISYANQKFLEAFQFSFNELSKINFRELIDPEYLLNNSFELEDAVKSKNKNYELPLINKSGHKIFVLASIISTTNKNKVVSYNLILTDITLRKESEKDMMLIRSVFEASVDGIALIHKNKFALLNDSFVKMFGYESVSELLELEPIELVHEKDKWRISNFIELAEEGRESPSRYSFTAIRKDGSTFEAENSVSFYEFELDRFIVWVLRDQTEEFKARQALLESEAKYRSITESINECIWAAEKKNNDLKAVFYTNAIKKITSYEAQEFLDDEELWGKIIHPDDVDMVGEKMDILYEDPIRKMETLEYRIIDKLGNIIWIENKITCIRDERGKIQKVFGIISDITLSKKAEEELKRSTKELKELNETKDRFISIISHDLRTPFSSIIGFADLILNDKSLDDEKRNQYIQFIKDSSKSMLSLVNSLLDWTRLQTGRIKFEPDRINAKYVIEKSFQILSGVALQKNINLINEVEKDFFIHADENLLLQVFNNLISNAIKFTKHNGHIKISAKLNVELKQVEFNVIDDGIGIKKEDINKLFKVDTKFTTSGTDGEKGSGLGLSLVYEIIKKHGGDIWVNSEVGKGTQFTFSIPVASSYILLVDDSKTDRLLYTKLIKSLMPNYSILEAENGKKALDVIKENLPALVITDHNMPVMNGYDFVKQLSIIKLKYNPPVIVLSGDVNKAVENEYKEFGVDYIFAKPVNLAKFKDAIERSLKKAIFS